MWRKQQDFAFSITYPNVAALLSASFLLRSPPNLKRIASYVIYRDSSWCSPKRRASKSNKKRLIFDVLIFKRWCSGDSLWGHKKLKNSLLFKPTCSELVGRQTLFDLSAFFWWLAAASVPWGVEVFLRFFSDLHPD